jgi:hypothetical protein
MFIHAISSTGEYGREQIPLSEIVYKWLKVWPTADRLGKELK